MSRRARVEDSGRGRSRRQTQTGKGKKKRIWPVLLFVDLLAIGVLAGILVTGTDVLKIDFGGFSPEVTGISISKKGSVTQVVKENFGESYYSEEELETMIDQEVASYQEQHGEDSVKKKKLKLKDGVMQLTMQYASGDDYAEFNSVDFYVGDIQGAIQQGCAFEGSFYPISGGETSETSVWGSSLMSGTDYKTVVISEALLVEVPGEITYVSENVKVTGTSEAVTETAETAYILYE